MAGTGGFGKAATDFFAALEDDNSRSFWQTNKATFETEVKAPMAALIASLPKTYQPFHVFRMNRDVRFAADKSPYKTMHGAAHSDRGAVHYLHLDADGFLVACGAYQMSPDQLERYRAAVDDDASGPKLVRLLATLEQKGLAVDRGGAEPLKSAPRGYPRDHPRIDLLRRKGIIASRRLTGTAIADADRLRAFVMSAFTDSRPLTAWISAHVGD